MNAREPRMIRIAEDRWATVRHIVEAIAIVAAGVWAFYTFIYQENIKPAGEPAALVQVVTVDRIGRDTKRDIVRLAIRMRNTGRREIDIAADAYSVWGDRYATQPRAVQSSAPGVREYSNLVPLASRRLIATFSELRESAVGGRAGHNLVIEPGADYTLTYVLVLPRGAYDVITAQAVAVPVKLPLREKVRVVMERRSDGSSWLTAQTPGTWEDDSETQFALIP